MINREQTGGVEPSHRQKRVANPRRIRKEKQRVKIWIRPHWLYCERINTFAVPNAFGLLHDPMRILAQHNHANQGRSIVKRRASQDRSQVAPTMEKYRDCQTDAEESGALPAQIHRNKAQCRAPQ